MVTKETAQNQIPDKLPSVSPIPVIIKLTDKAQDILSTYIREYQEADDWKKTQMEARQKAFLLQDLRGIKQIGIGLDADKVAAGNLFIELLNIGAL